jgi:hypothetical protein
LAKRHGVARVEAACREALALEVPSYRFVERFLARTTAATPVALKQIDPLIRELTLYRDAIERRTREGESV